MQPAWYTELGNIFTEQYGVDVYDRDVLHQPRVHILYLETNMQM